MQYVNLFYNFLLGTMSGITILGLSSNALFGVGGALAIFFVFMMFDGLPGNPFNRRL